MDNIITGFIGIALFLLFVGGLAESIGAVPFIVIVGIIGALAFYDYYENVRDARRAERGDTTADPTRLD